MAVYERNLINYYRAKTMKPKSEWYGNIVLTIVVIYNSSVTRRDWNLEVRI
jgi:hypothetical protein